MRKFFKVKIGDVYLTKDGTETALGCFLQIINISKLRELFVKNLVPSVDGTQVIQTFGTKDIPFAVSVALLPRAVGELLIDLYNSSSASGEILTFEATDGGGPDLAFDCQIVSFDYKDSNGDIWENAEIQLEAISKIV